MLHSCHSLQPAQQLRGQPGEDLRLVATVLFPGPKTGHSSLGIPFEILSVKCYAIMPMQCK